MCCRTVIAACEYVIVVWSGCTSISAACAVRSIGTGYPSISAFTRSPRQHLGRQIPDLHTAVLQPENRPGRSRHRKRMIRLYRLPDRHVALQRAETAASPPEHSVPNAGTATANAPRKAPSTFASSVLHPSPARSPSTADGTHLSCSPSRLHRRRNLCPYRRNRTPAITVRGVPSVSTGVRPASIPRSKRFCADAYTAHRSPNPCSAYAFSCV